MRNTPNLNAQEKFMCFKGGRGVGTLSSGLSNTGDVSLLASGSLRRDHC